MPPEIPREADDIKEFYDQSPDRGLAISLPAILENRVTMILQTVMRPDQTIINDLFRQAGALGTFGVKIQVAYVFGLISKETYQDLNAIVKIRNAFAHRLEVKTFEDQSVSARIRSMHVYKILVDIKDSLPYEPGMRNLSDKSHFEKALSFVIHHQLDTMRDSFRECVRLLIHHLNKIHEIHESARRSRADDASPSS